MERSFRRPGDVRAEIVTTMLVAAGTPEGVHDLGRLLENLNNPAIARQVQLNSPVVRPLYRATASLELEAPLLVKREDIIFITFEGPYFTRGLWRAPAVDVPALLMAPPFQFQGTVAVAEDAEATQGLRGMAQRFFIVRDARVFDTEGALLGEGEQIIVNGQAVQMMSATSRHIASISAVPSRREEPEAAEAAEQTPAQRSSAA